jgi:hypothetical protein
MDKIKKCGVCGEDLSPVEFLFHDKCCLCEFCKEPVHKDIVKKLADEKEMIHHQPCYDKKLQADFDAKPVTITNAHLEMLNRLSFAFKPNRELSPETNQELCENNYRPWFQEQELEDKFLIVKRLEAIAAMMHVLIGSKDRKYITQAYEKREAEKFKERDKYLEESLNRKKVHSEAAKRSFERLDKDARARRDSINGFIKMGFSEEEAEKMVDEARNKVVIKMPGSGKL